MKKGRRHTHPLDGEYINRRWGGGYLENERPLYKSSKPRHRGGFNAPLALAIFLPLFLAFLVAPPITAQRADPPAELHYVVQPGDTLPALADAYGVPLQILQHYNGLQHPRHLYLGQRVRIPISTGQRADWVWQPLGYDEDLPALAQRVGVPWETLALANRVLNPAVLQVGQSIYRPAGHLGNPLAAARTAEADSLNGLPTSRVAGALRAGVPLWEMWRYNPRPVPTGQPLLLPGAGPAVATGGGVATGDLPAPLTALQLSPQPLPRGQTALLLLQTSQEIRDCTVAYLEQVESCYLLPQAVAAPAEAQTWLALAGLPALLEPGRYSLTLSYHVVTADDTVTGDSVATTFSLPLLVAAGRYDYERIDLPPDRQSLLDPQRSQAEREKIAALRPLRSPERHWELPFQWPFSGNVTSYYGSRRSYGYGFTSYHGGTDFRAEIGDPVLAPAAGRVVLAEPLVVRGNAILLDHGWGLVSGYWHLSRLDVTVGQLVAQGERIGAVGNTGLSTGPHLHWELWVNGMAVDPLQFVRTDPLSLSAQLEAAGE